VPSFDAERQRLAHIANASINKVIDVTGNLAFGTVELGSQRDMTVTIASSGTATLTVTGLSISRGLARQLTASLQVEPSRLAHRKR
jgi:hypothetical protein